MGRKKKQTNEVLPELTRVPSAQNAIRDTQMFKDHVAGLTHAQLAVKYEMSERNVAEISSIYRWRDLRQELAQRALAAAMDDVKSITVTAVKALKRDIQLIAERAVKKKRQLTKEERDHMRAMLDRMWKEIRLEDGKPTDSAETTLEVRLRLPPGATGFGLIPPDPRVKFVESKVEDAAPKINLDEIEDGTS
jgi:hypothetical protein